MNSPGASRLQHRVPYTIKIDTVRRVVRVLVSGIIDAEEGPLIATDARRSAGESGLNILYDIRAASPGKLENSDIFWWPRTVPAFASYCVVSSLYLPVDPERKKSFTLATR